MVQRWRTHAVPVRAQGVRGRHIQRVSARVIGGPEPKQKSVPWMAYTDAEVEEVRIVMTIYTDARLAGKKGRHPKAMEPMDFLPQRARGGVAGGARRKRTKAEAEAETFLHHAKRARAGARVGVRARAGARVGVGKRARK